MRYDHPEEIEILLAHDMSEFDSATIAAIKDNAQCMAYTVLWLLDNEYADEIEEHGFSIECTEQNYVWSRITVEHYGRVIFIMQETVSGTWVVSLGGDGTAASYLAAVAGSLGCRY